MARRGGQPGRVPASQSYISGRPDAESDESAWQSFLRTEVFSPEKRQGNINMLVSISMFAVGIVGVRMFGDLMVPV